MATAMNALIEKINKLQDLCADSSLNGTIELPQIVVIGSQSCGKTSVIENIVGRDFLPRGSGIVTRRPLVLQLIYQKGADPEYCVFNHRPERRYTNFEEVKREILSETQRVLKTKNDVSHVPITLKMYSSRVLSLTLVDLPGLVKVPMGDQPRNICAKIEEMCRRFVANRNAIILAVSAANADIANSDALQLARDVDPEYERTIGVLTKLDIMDRGTDVVDILARRKINLRLGFVPVVNRSQADIVSNKDIRAALRDEKRFFETHPSYRKNRLYCGTPHLVQKLNGVLHEHIRACLPDLQQHADRLLAEARSELSSIGTANLTPKEFVFKTINDFARRFSDVLQGRCELSSTELCGGARLNYTFHSHFSAFISKLEALGGVDDGQIRTLLYNSSGSSSTILFAHVAFEKLAKQSIATLKPHSLNLVNIIFSELVKILHKICNDMHLPAFPALHDRVVGCLVSLFKRRSESAHRLVAALLDWNAAYINTKNPNFARRPVSSSGDVEPRCRELLVEKGETITFDPVPHTLRITETMTEHEVAEIEMIKSLVKRYFDTIKEIIVDQVPKAIMCELVIKSEAEMHETMFNEIYEAENIAETITEPEEIKERRDILERSISVLKQACDIICSI